MFSLLPHGGADTRRRRSTPRDEERAVEKDWRKGRVRAGGVRRERVRASVIDSRSVPAPLRLKAFLQRNRRAYLQILIDGFAKCMIHKTFLRPPRSALPLAQAHALHSGGTRPSRALPKCFAKRPPGGTGGQGEKGGQDALGEVITHAFFDRRGHAEVNGEGQADGCHGHKSDQFFCYKVSCTLSHTWSAGSLRKG